jgi:hypothetical protein
MFRCEINSFTLFVYFLGIYGLNTQVESIVHVVEHQSIITRCLGDIMNYTQAKTHNNKINEQIKALQGEYLTRCKVRVIERMKDGKRVIILTKDTDYVKMSQYKDTYKDYRAMYPDEKRYFIVIDPIEDEKRSVQVRLPRRTDDDREPNVGLPDPGGDPFAIIS